MAGLLYHTRRGPVVRRIEEQVDLSVDGLYLVKNGKIEEIERPSSGFGRQSVLWQDGEPVNIEVNQTKKI